MRSSRHWWIEPTLTPRDASKISSTPAMRLQAPGTMLDPKHAVAQSFDAHTARGPVSGIGFGRSAITSSTVARRFRHRIAS